MEKDKESTEINPTKVYWEEFSLALQEYFQSLQNFRQNPNLYK